MYFRTVFFLSVFLCIFFSGSYSVHAATRINHLGISGKSIISSTVNPPNLKDGLVGYWTFDGKDMKPNVRDTSGQGNHGQLSGFTSTTTVPGKVGQALTFDGADDRVDVGTAATLSGPFTISAWVSFSAFSAENHDGIVVNGGTPSEWAHYGLSLDPDGAHKFAFWSGTGGITYIADSVTRSLNTWYHVVGVLEGTGANQAKIYVNGVLSTTGTLGYPSSSGNTYLGNWRTGVSFLTGKMDDVRLYNRALSASEVAQLYKLGNGSHQSTSVNPPNLQSGLVGYWTFDGKDMIPNVRDISGQGNHGTLSGFTSTTTVPGKMGQALSFDGVNDTVGLGITGLPSGSSARTMSVWVYAPSNDTGIIFGYGTGGVNNTFGFLNEGVIKLWGFGVAADYVTGYTLALNKWTLLTLVYDGTNRQLYVNGVFVEQQAWTYDTVVSLAYLGSEFGSSNYFRGILDDVRIYNRALSAAEVLQLYNLAR